MRVAIITSDFSGFTGSEIVAMEVANYFAEKGNKVVIRAERHSNALRSYLNVKVKIADKRIDISDFDLVWSQHGHFSLNTTDLNRLKNWKGHFVSVHLSGYTPAETYHHPFAARYALSRVFNSSEAMDSLEVDTPLVGKSLNLMNAAPKEFHQPPRALVKKLRRLLVVSNHLPQEMQDAMKIAEGHGLKVSHLGLAGSPKLIRPADISEADAIISIGKTVQYSLCSARPVYCYDQFGGPGWLTVENFEKAEYKNFSGRCNQKIKSAQTIFKELTDGFEVSEAFVVSNWEHYCDKYNLDKFMDDLISKLSGNLFHMRNCIEEVSAMRGAVVHFEAIWRDVYSSSRKFQYSNPPSESTQARIFMLEDILTKYLENPWMPLKDILDRRMSSLAAKVFGHFSTGRKIRFANSARKRNPRRFKSPGRD